MGLGGAGDRVQLPASMIRLAVLGNEASVRPGKDGAQRAPGRVTAGRAGRGSRAEGVAALSPCPTPCAVRPLHLAVPQLYPLIVNP